ncbi:MAG: Xaa-Pro peptidase family protein [Peptococcaceae bacterium]
MNNRCTRVREKLKKHHLEAVLVTRPENRRYLSGFTGSSGALVISEKEKYFLADFRYLTQLRTECPDWQVIQVKESLFTVLSELLAEIKVNVLGCEGDFLTYQQFKGLQDKLAGRTLTPLSEFVEELREVKETAEIMALEKAAAITTQAFNYILNHLQAGKTEKEISLALEFFMRSAGGSTPGFELIVASGPNSARPHGTATGKPLNKGDLVVIDLGCGYDGYYADFTRTVVLGEPTVRQKEIYQLVLKAQSAGFSALKSGIKAQEVDKEVRQVIEAHGWGENFGHSTGHGVGLAVHESPALAKDNETILKPGMVVTVEPGVYLPDWGGVRIEDMVLVEEEGCRLLTLAPKESLIICG